MPFKSEAQRAYMNAAAERGDIKQSVVDEFNQASKGMQLPKRVSSFQSKDKHGNEIHHSNREVPAPIPTASVRG